jgi:hypothetical protein
MHALSGRLVRYCQSLAGRWLAATDGRRALALGVFCAGIFLLVNWRNYHRDVIPLAFAPVSLWRHGTLNVDEFLPYRDGLADVDRWAWTESAANGHVYSEKSVFVSLLVAPFYLPPVLAGVPSERYEFWIAWGRLAAAALTGLTVSLSYLTLRRWGDVTAATVFSLLLALGTCLWTIVGQMLWDHQAVLFVAILAWLLSDFPLSPRRAFFAALAAGAAVVLRPVTVVLLFPVGLYLLLPGRLAGWRGYVAAFAGILPLPLAMAVANSVMFGHWYSTGYPPSEYRDSWRTFWPEGSAGLLIAPNSGLFVQSPFTLLAVVGGWAAWRWRGPVHERGLLRAYTLCFLAYWALFAKWHDWQGGLTFATRMLSEGYPLWMPLVMVGWHWLREYRWSLAAVTAAGAWSVLYQLANLATFDATTGLNTKHLPWTPHDHFFAVHLSHYGAAATVKAVTVGALSFVAAGVALLVFLLLPLLRPAISAPCPPSTHPPRP